MRAQLTITVPVGKRLISRAIVELPEVKRALREGKLLLKGGTTVAAVMECLTGDSLRISGRVTCNGTKGALTKDDSPHSVLLTKGKAVNVDLCFAETVQRLAAEDIVIIGANALDSSGRAAIMLGSTLGGAPGLGMAGMLAQGCKIIIACGLEKLIPTSIEAAVAAAGMRSMNWAMGMAVGLMPLYGDVVTEKVALERLFAVDCVVIGAGGIGGAEGAVTEVKKAISLILSLQSATTAGEKQSLEECVPGLVKCGTHFACAWRGQKGTGKIF